MSSQTTLSILKPDVVRAQKIGAVIERLEAAGLRIVAQKMLQLDRDRAGEFYSEHRERPFFADLVEFMTSGPVVVQVLAGDNAVEHNRNIMGATNPAEAAAGTIRADFGASLGENAIHGSDSLQAAEREIAFFFDAGEIFAS